MDSTAPSFLIGGPRLGAGDPQPYDFSRPQAFVGADLRRVEAAHAAMAERLAADFSARLGAPARVDVEAVVEVLTVDYEKTRPQPAALFASRIGSGGPRIGVDLAPALALFLVERHLGGDGALGTGVRALSDLERTVVERQWLPLLYQAFAHGWGTVPPVTERFSTDPETLALAPPDAPAVVADLTVSLGGTPGPMTIVYPADTLRTLLSVPARPTVPRRAAPSVPVGTLSLPLRAELARTRLTVGEITRLAPGDVIPLASVPGAPVPVRIGDRLELRARAGTRGGRIALQVLTPPTPSTS